MTVAVLKNKIKTTKKTRTKNDPLEKLHEAPNTNTGLYYG